jgi:NAD(P)-dependent dehydrogenase (short-subunit alcohol dehydrogenase family)
MKAQGRGGSIVNIGTVLAEHALGSLPVSAALASKGGIRTLTFALAAELAVDRIRVNMVSPGFTDTPLLAGADHKVLADRALARRMGEVKDTTAAILYIAQATFVTGHVLHVDGGYVTGRQ